MPLPHRRPTQTSHWFIGRRPLSAGCAPRGQVASGCARGFICAVVDGAKSEEDRCPDIRKAVLPHVGEPFCRCLEARTKRFWSPGNPVENYQFPIRALIHITGTERLRILSAGEPWPPAVPARRVWV